MSGTPVNVGSIRPLCPVAPESKKAEVCSSELDDVLEVDDDFPLHLLHEVHDDVELDDNLGSSMTIQLNLILISKIPA